MQAVPESTRDRLNCGRPPGLIAAATGGGGGDIVASIVAGQPFALVLIYAALGAFFMPFLTVTLLWLPNSDRVGFKFRNRIGPHVIVVACVVSFGFLAIKEIINACSSKGP